MASFYHKTPNHCPRMGPGIRRSAFSGNYGSHGNFTWRGHIHINDSFRQRFRCSQKVLKITFTPPKSCSQEEQIVRWPITVMATKLTSRQKEKPHGKKNNLTAKRKRLAAKRKRFTAKRKRVTPKRIERLSMTFTANGKNETFAVCLQLSVQ